MLKYEHNHYAGHPQTTESTLTWPPLFLSVHNPQEAFCERTLDFSDLVARDKNTWFTSQDWGYRFYRLISTDYFLVSNRLSSAKCQIHNDWARVCTYHCDDCWHISECWDCCHWLTDKKDKTQCHYEHIVHTETRTACKIQRPFHVIYAIY